MSVPAISRPTKDSWAVALLKLNAALFARGGFPVASPFKTLAPQNGDTIQTSLRKINQILSQRNPALPTGPFSTLAYKHGDTKEISLRKINQIYYAGGT